MKIHSKLTTVATTLAVALLSSPALANDMLSRLSVPKGYELSYFAKDVENWLAGHSDMNPKVKIGASEYVAYWKGRSVS